LIGASFSTTDIFKPTDQFLHRHLGPREVELGDMLRTVGCSSLDELVQKTVPAHIIRDKPLNMEPSMSESEALNKIREITSKNTVNKSLIGMGFYETMTPGVVLRNMLENPGWYTAYTPYQAEVSQGRLQSLLNFQTMVADLTGMAVSNASLLDESTACAEAMSMCYGLKNQKRKKFFVASDCHPQNVALVQTRGEALGVEIIVGDPMTADFSQGDFCGALLQYPNTYGSITDLENFVKEAHASQTMVVASTDLLACTLIKPPGEFGVDIAVGTAQRLGVPMNYGGPHAGYMATSMKYSRKLPGRLIGVSVDSQGKPALRMAMQTREQHIRRDKATSNICTAQALLANMASAYGVYHGPEGMKQIAARIHYMTHATKAALEEAGYAIKTEGVFFDTITVDVGSKGKTSSEVQSALAASGLNCRVVDEATVGLSFGETINKDDVKSILCAFGSDADVDAMASTPQCAITGTPFLRSSEFMTHPVFHSHHSETQMLRYLKALENKDLALNTSMISLGSCTMKLNATVEMQPVTWPEICNMHPFAPADQCQGYMELIESLHKDLAEITGFAAVSSQPNSGAQGEYAGLLCIRKYHQANGDHHRKICLIPVSAHGTNPASAVMAGMKVVVVNSDENGNIDLVDLKAKADKHADNLAALMITYPSTYGVFEEGVKEIIDHVHSKGGQVYMDGANMNAQVGLTSPGTIGADVCHLNLHKTFCIPHGGGGPGVGSIGVAKHLAPYLPGHNVVKTGGEGDNVAAKVDGAVAAAPFGSAAILPISWMYIKMLGGEGLKKATSIAILNANYMAKRVENAFPVLFRGSQGMCAHEFIIDLRPFKQYGIVEEDVAKRLQDYGFHSPTMSWPVPGTLMVEPTESEDKQELDRLCDSLLLIRQEIEDVVQGRLAVEDSPLKAAPHTLEMALAETWDRKYSREVAAYPAPWVKANKFWPTVGRVDNVYGDRNLVCSCPPMEDYMEAAA